MDKLYLFKNVASLGGLALGAITTIGIATAPVHAVSFTQDSTLEWDDTTNSFVQDATAAFIAEAGTFDIIFSGSDVGGVANVGIATGDFDPFFDNPPPDQVPIIPPNSATGTFEFTSLGTPDPGTDIEAIFTLINDPVVFTFDTSVNGVDSPVVLTLDPGATFLGELKDDGAVEFELLDPEEWLAELPNGIEGKADSSVFEFGETAAAVGGTYGAEGDFSEKVPEPASILGILTVGGLGLGLKRKKQL